MSSQEAPPQLHVDDLLKVEVKTENDSIFECCPT